MPQASSSQSSYIDLITSDEPSVRLTVTRSVLTSFSKTFQDLLSLPLLDSNTPACNKVDIEENEVQMEGFLRMLEAFAEGEEADLSKLDLVDWENLARLSDKYNAIWRG